MTKPRVALVIPVLNEEAAIGAVVRAASRAVVDEIIVVDGGSRDDTVRVATEAGARTLVVRERGYGRACHEGAVAALPGTEIVAFLDGDGSDDPALLPAVIAPIVEDRADFVLGSRTRGVREPGSMTALQVWSGRLIGLVLWARYGVRYTDMSPFRAIRRAALTELGMREMTYGWNLEMQMRAAGAGLRVVEVPVATRRRAGGESKVSGSLRGTVKAGARILATLARVAFENSAPLGRGRRA
ncbi:MAG TPA: glycosyltransferase family 2 protein [Candidatus Sulfotelmatobacter sp.]|nr:glycosyltransferase family 2 protein [Candidatus Sulfotelmatobacter sp.]